MILPPANTTVCGRVRTRMMARGPVPHGANGSQQPGSAVTRTVTVPPLTTGSETSVVDGWAVSLEVDDAHADMSRVTSTTAILAPSHLRGHGRTIRNDV